MKHNYLYLISHGPTKYSPEQRFIGRTDTRLNKEGERAARKISRKLKGKTIHAVFTSPLLRCRHTARAAVRSHNVQKTVTLPGLTDRDYGQLEKKKRATILRECGPAKYASWTKAYDVRPPKGESLLDVQRRASTTTRHLLELAASNKLNILVCTHPLVINMMRKYLEDLTRKKTLRLRQDPLKIHRYRVQDYF